MSGSNVGEHIKELRKERNISQLELAEKLHISRQTISKWELGKSLPDSIMMKDLSKIFNVSIDEIINGKKISKVLDKKKFKWKLKNIILVLFLILVIVILIFYLYLNSSKIYKITGQSDKISISNGIFVETNKKIYFQLGEIIYNGSLIIKNMELYYVIDEEKTVAYSCNNCSTHNVIFTDTKNYNNYFEAKKINYIIKNLYLKLTFENGEEDTLKLTLIRNFLYNKKIEESLLEKNENKVSGSDLLVDNNMILKIKKNFKKKNDGYVYETILNQSVIYATYINNELLIDIKKNKNVEYWGYNFQSNVLTNEIYEDSQLKSKSTFIVDSEQDDIMYKKFYNIFNNLFK